LLPTGRGVQTLTPVKTPHHNIRMVGPGIYGAVAPGSQRTGPRGPRPRGPQHGWARRVRPTRRQSPAGLVPRVKTPRVRASAVANANVIQTLVSDDRDPVNHLGWANVRIEHAARPILTQHLRDSGPFDIGSITLYGVSHGRLAVGVSVVDCHRCLARHAGTWVRTLPSPVRSRKANCPRRKANR